MASYAQASDLWRALSPGSDWTAHGRRYPIAGGSRSWRARASGASASIGSSVFSVPRATPTARARLALNQLLYAAQRDLRCGALVSGSNELRLDGDPMSCDAWDFDEALERGERDGAVAL